MPARDSGDRGTRVRAAAPDAPARARGTRTGAGRTGEAARSGTRPATARRAASPATARRTAPPPAPRRRNGRVTALALVMLALMLAYAYPVRLYLNQEAQIHAIEASQAAQRQRIQQLTDLSALWSSTPYIEEQARERFLMVAPGSKTYIIQMPPVTPSSAAPSPSPQPWYGTLWSSVQQGS